MKITILTQYYPPETGAPQNRLSDLAKRLKDKGCEVIVLTAMPNYPVMEVYPGYKGRWFKTEQIDGITVIRSWIFVRKGKGIFTRLLNYYSFVISSFFIGLFRLPASDYLIVESPPLFLGKTAFLLSRIKRARLIFNVSDLWPESAEKLELVTNRFMLWISYKLELFLYRKSWLITGQTQGIVNDIRSRTSGKEVYWLPNGADTSSFDPEQPANTEWRRSLGISANDFVFLYAGIIGHAQGLEVILKAASIISHKPEIKFVILGSGPEKEKLVEMKKEMAITNVVFADPVAKNEMPGILAAINASVIPLRKLDLFLGAIPSKLFECLAIKKPLLLGVNGEAKQLFIEQAEAGLSFEPENAASLAEMAVEMAQHPDRVKEMGERGYQFVLRNFNRQLIAEKFMDKLNTSND